MKTNILFYIICGIILFMFLRTYYISENFQLKCVISSVDGKKYCGD